MTHYEIIRLGFKIAITIWVAYAAIWGLVCFSGVVRWELARELHNKFMAGAGCLSLIGALVFAWVVM